MIAWAAVFAAVAALDFAWAHYTAALNNRIPVRAAVWAGAIILLSGTAAVGYTHDPWLLIPACAGAFTRTYFAVRQHTRT